MPQGQSISQKFYIIRDSPTLPAPLSLTSNLAGCCFELPVLAETSPTNDLYNDFTGFVLFWNNAFSTATLILQKSVSGTWTDTATLNVDTWGTAYTFGFWTDIYGQNAIGYKLDWDLVLAAFGEGSYRIKSVGTPLFGAVTQTQYSFEYCLKTYTEQRANETVRIDFKQNGIIGDRDSDYIKRDFGILDWENSIRLPDSMFGNDSSPSHEKEYVKYQNGSMIWLSDNQVEEYILRTGRLPNFLHKFIKIDVLQADEIKVTDYNLNNPTKHTEKDVVWSGNYEPTWTNGNLYAPVEIRLQQAYQNFNKKRV